MDSFEIKTLNLAVPLTCFANGATRDHTDGNDTKKTKQNDNNMPLKLQFLDETKKIECEHCVRANLNRLI